MVKTLGGQRESEGVVVPLIGARNAPGGKGPCFDHAREAGKCEGMTGFARSNYSGEPWLAVADEEPLEVSPVKVRKLQRALWAAAKQSKGRRFQALYDRVYRGDVLWEAWERVRKNKGAAGVDRITLAAVEDYGVDRMLRELRDDLRTGRYRPAPARRVEIPKPQGGKSAVGDSDGAGPGGSGGGQDRVGTDFRGGFLVVLVWVLAEEVGDDGKGAFADRVHRGLPVCGRVRYRQFLRRDRPRPVTH